MFGLLNQTMANWVHPAMFHMRIKIRFATNMMLPKAPVPNPALFAL
jgi:hypothetical protein